jgi:hypothetical protein
MNDSDDQHKVTENSKNPNTFSDLLFKIRDKCMLNQSIDHEKELQQIKAKVRQQAGENHEAMLTLGIIDAKAQSLLSYISISVAAFVLILSALQNNPIFKFNVLEEKIFLYIILLLLVILSIAMFLCLLSVDTIGAHTVKSFKSKEAVDRLNEYNELLFKLTLRRRTKYLIAHRLCIVASLLFILLTVLLIFTLR